ncbi:hypothetical protein [Amycolatopsis sp. NPDC051372]|uniref:GP88 family protein n=1 Tax=Amycolatopsis sp. NPDC051372 TaxID=3155669 RepID=UPI003418EA3C
MCTKLSTSDSRPARLLTQNREMRQIGVWNWSLPAWAGHLPDGRTYNTCPSAGVCAQACYARNGTYTWPVVLAKHQANLAYVLDDLAGWRNAMVAELSAQKFCGAWIRIHDSGDFFSDQYLRAWLDVCRERAGTNFYAYTNEAIASGLRRCFRAAGPGPSAGTTGRSARPSPRSAWPSSTVAAAADGHDLGFDVVADVGDGVDDHGDLDAVGVTGRGAGFADSAQPDHAEYVEHCVRGLGLLGAGEDRVLGHRAR